MSGSLLPPSAPSLSMATTMGFLDSLDDPPRIPEAKDGLQLPPLNPIRREGEGYLAVPGPKERAAWSITQACMASIGNNLRNSESIDHEAIEILLASMERSERASGYSFENWRTAVEIVVAEARRLEAQGIAELTESIMGERERALTEAEMSLNDELIRRSKTEKVIRDRSAAKGEIAAEIEGIEREICSLREQLVLRERDLRDWKRELEAAEEDCSCLQRNLEHAREAVGKKEEVVRAAGASLDSAEEDARAERDRRQAWLRLSIAQLQGFEIGIRHPGLP